MSEKKRLGWIGVGSMGAPMAARLCAAGYEMTVCGSGRRDLSPYAAQTGAQTAKNPMELAERVDVIFTMIPNGEVLLQIAEQVAKAPLAGKILVDMSTVDPDASRRAAELLEQAGGALLRAPVTGSTHYAAEGTLGIMVSGERAVFEQCLPYLRVLGNRQTYLGSGEEARVMKLLINMLLAQELQALSEALVLGRRLGLPEAEMLDLIADSAAGAPIYQYKKNTLRRHDFTPTSTGYNMHKDMKLATKLAAATDTAIPTAAVTMQMYNTLMAMGLGKMDNTSIYLVNERLNRVYAESDEAASTQFQETKG